MSDGVELVWPNKGLRLCASGPTNYLWLDPSDRRLEKPLKVEVAGGGGASIGPLSNVLVAGDGLDAIEALTPTGAFDSGIRAVYIDPPFNTQKTFTQYGDSMSRPMWLSMMHDRLEALKPLLADDASIWLHLDDSEVHRARAVMDEVFGEDAFVASVIWQKKNSRDSRAAFSPNHDTILVYSPQGPQKWKMSRNLLPKDASELKNRDNDPRGAWADAPFTAPGYRAGQQYPITTPSGNVVLPPRGRSWYGVERTFLALLDDNRIWFPRNGAGKPRIKMFPEHLRGLVPFTIWGSAEVGTNDDAKRHLLALFPDKEVFDTPKPEELIERILHIATNPGDLVVDLFGGSGTTAAVAHKTDRRWIVVERSAKTIFDFALPRLQAVVAGRDGGGITQAVGWTGGGRFDFAHVTPRFGSLTGTHRLVSVRKRIATFGLVLP